MSGDGVRNNPKVVRSELLDNEVGRSLLAFAGQEKFGTILADPPWRFVNRTGKMAPEHKRLSRYQTMSTEEIAGLPVSQIVLPQAHLYLWVPNALILEGLEVMKRWGFTYKTNIVWYKVRKDGGPDGRGVGFYFRNVTELVLFGVRGGLRTLPPGRRQTNIIVSMKRRHSHKPDQLFEIIERCSPEPFLELFARHPRPRWSQWGDEAPDPSVETAPLFVQSPSFLEAIGEPGSGSVHPSTNGASKAGMSSYREQQN